MSRPRSEIQSDLSNLIYEQEQRIILSLNKERRLNLIELARAMDNFLVGQIANPEWGKSRQAEELAHLIAFGLHKALSVTIDESCKCSGAPLFTSTKGLQAWADSVLQHCGRLGYCKYLLELYRVGLVEIKKPMPNQFHAHPAANSTGAEIYERENFLWARKSIAQSQRHIVDALRSVHKDVSKMVAARVDRWRTHYIQYTTTPEIDLFYETEGVLKARMMLGHDSFPQDATFGGQEFRLYCAAVAITIGRSLKHLGFCFELIKKSPDIEPRNILTITHPLEEVIQSLSAALEVDQTAAKQAVDILTLTLENKREHCSVTLIYKPYLPERLFGGFND